MWAAPHCIDSNTHVHELMPIGADNDRQHLHVLGYMCCSTADGDSCKPATPSKAIDGLQTAHNGP
eukprot:14413154-Alexandrium_andersonii.AAC.2